MKYWFNGMFVLNFVWKARRKEKDAVANSQESKLYLEQAALESTMSESRLREIIDLPAGLDYNEWLASHTTAFFEHINLIYGTISEFCTMSECPEMSGPYGKQYLWFDEKGKKCRVTAPQYIDCVMVFTQKTVHDEAVFPTKFDRDFPCSFESTVKKIHKLLFHVLAHIYHAHFKEIVLLNMHTHLNTVFSHFILFSEHFNIVEEKETEVLQDLAAALKLYGVNADSELENKTEDGTSSKEVTTPVLEDNSTADSIKDCLVSNVDTDERLPNSSLSSQSHTSSISAFHSRSSSGSHLSNGSCAMDSTLYCQSMPPTPNFGSSSPPKFQ